jgi:N-acetylglutamate synthase
MIKFGICGACGGPDRQGTVRAMTTPVLSDPTLADEATAALIAATAAMYTAAPPGPYYRPAPSACALVSGVPLPFVNTLIITDDQVSPETVNELADEVVARGLPYNVQVRPAAAGQVADVLAARGLRPAGTIPLMVLNGAPRLDLPHEALTLRELHHGQGHEHRRLVSDVFGVPLEMFEDIFNDDVLTTMGSRCYVGDVDGQPVVTGLSIHTGQHVGVFDMATAEQHRGRGYGAALAIRMVADGFVAGATRAYLQSTDLGYGVYQRIGFRQVETWSMWT